LLSLSPDATLIPVLSVSELTEAIRGVLEISFEQVAVTGEISNAKMYPSGHWYFSLKDADAVLPCVCFKNTNSTLKFNLEDGLSVVAHGKIGVWPPRGGYQLVVESLEPIGVGAWQLAFEQLKQKLTSEGLLDASRKRPLPVFPRRIGVVSSLAAAALKDVLIALSRRNRGVRVVVSPTRVQGDGSAEEIAAAIERLQHIEGIEVILLVRGGGSIEDLWSFNTEPVARAVAASKVPVVSGVGHETDLTICDLVADLRAPTPTAAAELVARGYSELLESWINLNRRLLKCMEYKLDNARWSLQEFDPRRMLMHYEERLNSLTQKLSATQQRMVSLVSHWIESRQQQQSSLHEKLQALGPLNILKRGFSIVRKLDGNVVRDVQQVKEGELLEILLSEGRLVTSVQIVSRNWTDSSSEDTHK
jgi:exodeoxyribonuclease VII large subunit